MFFVVGREEKGKNNDNWSFCFSKKSLAETSIFIVFSGRAFFGPSCQKREILDTHQKKAKTLTDNWKALFWYSLCFLFLFRFCLFFCFSGPPYVALNPPYLFFVCFLGGLVFLLLWFFFGGFKGQVRWPEGPPHLAPNPPYLLSFFLLGGLFVSFLFFAFNTKNWFFPKKRAFSVHFWVSPFVFP